MTKKKSNGFMYFADSRRAFYEAEAGCNFGSKRLVERAADDWKQMSHTEQEHWKSESKRRAEEQGNSHSPHHIHHHGPRQKQRVMSQLEKELIERAKERGVDRATARQTLTDKLLWKEQGEVATTRLLRWALIVLSKDSAGVIPNEICAIVMEKGAIVGEMRLIRRGFQPKTSRNIQNVKNIVWDPSLSSDVNMAAVQLVKFVQGSWNGLVMVPEHQMSRLGIAMHWMKQNRDVYCRRDTSTMRLDRIMCLEDVITVFREVNERSPVDAEEDEQYEQLRDLELNDTILFGRAAAEYFARVMKRCTMPPAPPIPQLHQYYPYTHLYQHYPSHHHYCDLSISDNSSSEVTPTVHSQGDACWALGPPICATETREPELYPIHYEPQRRKIFGKMAGNPFTRPPTAQSTEPGLSHVARWLDTIRLDDIEKYHEPFPEAYEESEENEEILPSDCAGSN